MNTQNHLKIGSYFLFPKENKLKQSDGVIKSIEPLLTAIILFLKDRSPEIVTHAELIERFWGPTVKGRDALTKSISKIRNLFPFEVISTCSKVGYKWVASEQKNEDQIVSKYTTNWVKAYLSRPVILVLLLAILLTVRAIVFPHPH